MTLKLKTPDTVVDGVRLLRSHIETTTLSAPEFARKHRLSYKIMYGLLAGSLPVDDVKVRYLRAFSRACGDEEQGPVPLVTFFRGGKPKPARRVRTA